MSDVEATDAGKRISPYHRGYLSGFLGVPLHMNPHSAVSKEAGWWLMGHEDARVDRKQPWPPRRPPLGTDPDI